MPNSGTEAKVLHLNPNYGPPSLRLEQDQQVQEDELVKKSLTPKP